MCSSRSAWPWSRSADVLKIAIVAGALPVVALGAICGGLAAGNTYLRLAWRFANRPPVEED